jgi:hypothetical protein
MLKLLPYFLQDSTAFLFTHRYTQNYEHTMFMQFHIDILILYLNLNLMSHKSDAVHTFQRKVNVAKMRT